MRIPTGRIRFTETHLVIEAREWKPKWLKREFWFNCTQCAELEARYEAIMNKIGNQVLLPWCCTKCHGPLVYPHNYGVIEDEDLIHEVDCAIESQAIERIRSRLVEAHPDRFLLLADTSTTKRYIEEGHPF